MQEVITAAENKSFSDFMDNVRPYLDNKLKDNEYFNKKAKELKYYNNLESIFSQVDTILFDADNTR